MSNRAKYYCKPGFMAIILDVLYIVVVSAGKSNVSGVWFAWFICDK
jgi:hypothetical protein